VRIAVLLVALCGVLAACDRQAVPHRQGAANEGKAAQSAGGSSANEGKSIGQAGR
jgi:hypothetical protein